MPTFTIEYTTEAERIILERAVAFVTQMRRVAVDAPAGTVVDACERVALTWGRTLLKDVLGAAIRGRADLVDAKKKGPAAAPIERRERRLMTAVGPVRVNRDYLANAGDVPGGFRADRELGIDGYLTCGATRMAALAGVGAPFDKAAKVISELAGRTLDGDTVRLAAHPTARRAASARPERPTRRDSPMPRGPWKSRSTRARRTPPGAGGT